MRQLSLECSDKIALVDDHNYDRLRKYKWYHNPNGNVYRCYYEGKTHVFVSLACEVMNRPGQMFDHKDRNSLNNQEENLREATYQLNNVNKSKLDEFCSSKYKGVSRRKGRIKCWQAAIRFNYKLLYLGSFFTQREAALAYDRKAEELFGNFAVLNFPELFSGEKAGILLPTT